MDARRVAAVMAAALVLIAVQAGLGRAQPRDPGSPAWAHASDGDVPPGAAPVHGRGTSGSSSSWLEGIDVSHWDGTIDWSQVAASGKSFVIMKATDGETYVDPTYGQNRRGALAAGLAVGAYHFARPESTPGDAVTEADHFVDVAGIGARDIIPVLDLERQGDLSTDGLIAWAEDWLQEVKARTGITPMIYSGPSRWSTVMGDTEQFADEGYRLWLAHWTTGAPWVPANDWGGRGWTFWQYTDCGAVPGIEGCVDLDHFDGTSLAAVRIPELTVTTNRVGTVTSTPEGIDCGPMCRSIFDPGSTASLTATPDPGAVLVQWGGACSGSGGCTVRMAGNRRVDAVFGYTLSASVSGTGPAWGPSRAPPRASTAGAGRVRAPATSPPEPP